MASVVAVFATTDALSSPISKHMQSVNEVSVRATTLNTVGKLDNTVKVLS